MSLEEDRMPLAFASSRLHMPLSPQELESALWDAANLTPKAPRSIAPTGRATSSRCRERAHEGVRAELELCRAFRYHRGARRDIRINQLLDKFSEVLAHFPFPFNHEHAAYETSALPERLFGVNESLFSLVTVLSPD